MQPIIVTESNFEELILKSELPVLLDFWAPWCGPCKALLPKLDEVAKEFAGKAIIAKVNVDEAPALPSKFGVRGIPAMKFFVNGEEQLGKDLVGNHPIENIRAALAYYVKD